MDIITRGEDVVSDKLENTEKNLFVRVCNWVIDASLVLMVFGIPVFFLNKTFQGIIFEKQMFFYVLVLVALVFWALRGAVVGEMRIKRNPLDLPIILALAVALVTVILSVDKWHSFWGSFGDPSRGFIALLAIVATFYLILERINANKIKLFAGALIVSHFFVAIWVLISILNFSFIPQFMVNNVPVNLVGSFTGLVIFLSIMIPFMMGIFLKIGENVTNKHIRIFGQLFVTVNMLLNLFLMLVLYSFVSLSIWISLMAGVAFFLIYILANVVKVKKYSNAWFPMFVFIALMVLFMGGKTMNISKIQLPVEVSLDYKISWQIAKESTKDNFFFGSGPATYGYDFSLHKPQEFNLNSLYDLRFYQGTGIFFESLATVGAVGTLFMLIMILSFVGASIYFISLEKERDKIYSLAFLSASVVFLVNLLSSRIEGSVFLLGVLICALTLAILMKEGPIKENFINFSLKASPKFALTLALIFMVVSASVIFLFVFVGKVIVADTYIGSIGKDKISDESINKVVGAINLYGNESRYYTALAQINMALANQEVLKNEADRDVNKIQGYLNNAIALSQKASSLAGQDVGTAEALAQIYDNSGYYVQNSFQLAIDSYQKALELEPFNPNFIVKMGQVKLNQVAVEKDQNAKKKLVEDARDLFQKAVDEKENFSVGYYQLALTKDALGDVDGAIDSMTNALKNERDNLNLIFNLARLYQERGAGDDNATAESLYSYILSINEKEINTHFSLGSLYEKTNRKDEAVKEYKKVLELLSASASENTSSTQGGSAGSDQTKKQIQKMISNIQNGIENTQANLTDAPEATPEPIKATETVPATPSINDSMTVPNNASVKPIAQ
jgi:tetratricopeptide (TPR) repeat protein